MNILNATLTSITASEHLSILTASAGEAMFHLLLAEQCHEVIGTPLRLAFKETEVILSKEFTTSTANIQRAAVEKIDKGIVLSQITLLYHEITLTALVPTLTFNLLNIVEGDTISWMVQPSEISLIRS